MRNNSEHTKRGYILIVVIVFTALFLSASAALLSYVSQSARNEKFTVAGTQALALAESGIEKALYELNRNSSYNGESNTALGVGTFSVTVSSIDGSTKRITSTGYVPNSTNPQSTRVVEINAAIDSSIVSFQFGVQVGNGGITMANGSQVTGNVFANSSVTGSGTITGDTTVTASIASTTNQSWSTQTTTTSISDTAARTYIAQSFQPSANGPITKLSLNVRKVGSPDDAVVRIVNDASGLPGNTTLLTASIPASTVTGTLSFVDVILGSLLYVQANQTYWIIVSNTVSPTDYFVWGTDAGAGYTRGSGLESADQTTWGIASGDMNFKMFLSGATSTISGVTVQGNAWAPQLDSNCTIGGTAKFQTLSSCSITGQQFPGTLPVAPGTMPISDAQIDEWESIAEAGGILSGNQTISGSQTLGPVRINGNLTLSNNATLTLAGPVWVRGNILFGNNTTLTISSGLGNSGAILIADYPGQESSSGTVQFSNNMTVSGNGNAGSHPMVISTNTSGSAISLANNASSVILYAPYGTIQVSNNAGAAQITANTLQLNNNAVITYVNGLQSTSFSNGPGGSWTAAPGSYVIVR